MATIKVNYNTPTVAISLDKTEYGIFLAALKAYKKHINPIVSENSEVHNAYTAIVEAIKAHELAKLEGL